MLLDSKPGNYVALHYKPMNGSVGISIDTSSVLPLSKGELEGVAPRLSYLFHIMGDGTLQLMRFPIQRL